MLVPWERQWSQLIHILQSPSTQLLAELSWPVLYRSLGSEYWAQMAYLGGKLMEKRKKSCMGGNMERIELCPYCSSSLFLASESVLTVKDQRAGGCGHVPYPQGACSSQEPGGWTSFVPTTSSQVLWGWGWAHLLGASWFQLSELFFFRFTHLWFIHIQFRVWLNQLNLYNWKCAKLWRVIRQSK